MEKLLLLTVMFASCYATPQDLSGKVFAFPREGNGDHVKLLTNKTMLSSATVCLRFFTDLTRNHGIFYLSTPSHNNAFVLYKFSSEDRPVIRMRARDGSTDFQSLSFPQNTWHSICATWCSDSGLAQLWLNGKPTIKRFIPLGSPTTGAPVVRTPYAILGKEQESYGGWVAFDAYLPFIGMISKIHMWDYILSTTDIHGYVHGENFTPGNVFNWRDLDYEISGLVLVDEDPESV